MSGIVFFRTADEDRVVEFYRERVGAELWLDQDGCTILRHGDFKFGFCGRDATDDCGIVTFYYGDRAAVDERYDALADRARGPPEVNEQYEIYQFFAEDPDGRPVEFQTFLHPLPGEDGG
ncbi:MAG: VOC family protein [Haloarculaceae archaeon]